MAKGNSIVVSGIPPRGLAEEGTVGEAGIKPGHRVIEDPTALLDDNGRPTWILWDGTTGDADKVTIADIGFLGMTAEDTYAAGDRMKVYTPLPGEDLNIRVKASEVVVFGGLLTSEGGTGAAIVATTEKALPFKAYETVTPGAEALVHVKATGV